MKTFKYERYFHLSIIGSLIPLFLGRADLALHAMLVVIAMILMGILRFLIEML